MSAPLSSPRAGLDVEAVQADFPIIGSHTSRGKPLVFLDSAASAQKPQVVIDRISNFYETNYANIHRGVYELSATATRLYEGSRETVARFLGAADTREIVFTRNVTEAINLVAQSFVRPRVGAGDEILITGMEHHANIVPWQMVCEQTGARLVVVPITDAGELEPGAFESLLTDRTRFAAITQVSNALGTINPVKAMIETAHARGVPVLVDGAQAVPHMTVDVQDIDADFYGFTGHKIFGPTGAGVLHGKLEHLEAMPPYQGGGDMIETVTFEKSTYAPVPAKFEAGTPDIAAPIGLAAALDYVSGLGLDNIAAHEAELLAYASDRLLEIPGLKIYGTAAHKAAVISFVVDVVHPHDLGTILDDEGVAIRAGHHCAQPVMDRFGIPATARASFSIYNTRADADALAAAVRKAQEMFA